MGGHEARVRLGDGWLDLRERVVERGSSRTRMTAQEAALLEYLVARPCTDVGREEILREVWRASPNVVTRALDHTVSRLRRKIEIDPAEPVHLLTAHGVGYRFVGT